MKISVYLCTNLFAFVGVWLMLVITCVYTTVASRVYKVVQY